MPVENPTVTLTFTERELRAVQFQLSLLLRDRERVEVPALNQVSHRERSQWRAFLDANEHLRSARSKLQQTLEALKKEKG